MQIIGPQPTSSELLSDLGSFSNAPKRRVLNLITGLRAEEQEGGPPRLVVDVGPLAPENYKIAANRLAKALTGELTKNCGGRSSIVASIDIEPQGVGRTVPANRPGLGIDIAQLDNFLSGQLASLELSPHTITLFEVGLDSNRWIFLSLMYSRGPRCAELACRQLRAGLKELFGVHLRLVAAPERNQASALAGSGLHSSTQSSEEPNQADYGVSTHRGFRAGRRVDRPTPEGVVGWGDVSFTSIDAVCAQILEDMISAAPAFEPTLAAGELTDLRVVTPLRIPGFEALSPGVTLPGIGVQGLLAPGIGPVGTGQVLLVEACNGRACDVDLASRVMFDLPAGAELRSSGIELNADEMKLHTQLQSIRDAARILHDRDVAIGADLPIQVARVERDPSKSLRFVRAERVVSLVMRFMQEQILRWRDELDEPPALLVSRPRFKDLVSADRVIDKAAAQLAPYGQLGVNSMRLEPASLLCPEHRAIIVQALIAGKHRRELNLIPGLLHDAYCNRKLHLLEQDESSLPGDALHLKRGKFGIVNNLQVASAVLDFPLFDTELLRRAFNVSARRKNIDGASATLLGGLIRKQQAKLLDRLW